MKAFSEQSNLKQLSRLTLLWLQERTRRSRHGRSGHMPAARSAARRMRSIAAP